MIFRRVREGLFVLEKERGKNRFNWLFPTFKGGKYRSLTGVTLKFPADYGGPYVLYAVPVGYDMKVEKEED